jgi:hypothetical protein
MPFPIVSHPHHRTPEFVPGMLVAYWHFPVHPRTGLRTGECTEPVSQQGDYRFRGIVEIFDPEKSLPNLMGSAKAEPGELIIRILDAHGDPTKHYERVHHLPPMHETEWGKKHLKEPEVQRWYPLGVDPNVSYGG